MRSGLPAMLEDEGEPTNSLLTVFARALFQGLYKELAAGLAHPDHQNQIAFQNTQELRAICRLSGAVIERDGG